MRLGRLAAWWVTLGVWMLLAAPAGAEPDVAALLTGRWEGATEVPSPRHMPSRVLVLRNVRQDVSSAPGIAKWKADGAYGVTADKMARVAVDITVVEPTVTVEFITPEALHVTLKLAKPTVLEGTHLTHGGRALRIHLERRE